MPWMSSGTAKNVGETDVVVVIVVTSSFPTSEPGLILCARNDDAISPTSELLWESSVCNVVIDLHH